MYLKKKFINARFMLIALCVALVMPLIIVSAASAAVMPTVKDASGGVLQNNGRMVITADFDVFVDPQDGAQCYYAFNSVTVNDPVLTGYYDGAEGNPRGSHFGPPFTPGAIAFSITDPVGNGIRIGSDRKITVPNPTEITVLYVWAVANGAASQIFTYTFWPDITAGITVLDEGGNVLENGGQTSLTGSVDLFLRAGFPWIQYRYAFNPVFVEIYYDGEDSNPRGSYFEGSLIKGALATTRFISTPVGEDGKITVPDPTIYGVQNLKIAAFANGAEMLVFEYTFNIANYTVTFVDWDGTALDEQIIDYGKTATAPTPTREGYRFIGWMLDDIGFDLNTGITENITLVAKWEVIPITLLRIDAAVIETVVRGGIYNFGLILNEGAIGNNVVWSVSDNTLAFLDDEANIYILNRTGTVRLIATDPVSGISHSITLRIAS